MEVRHRSIFREEALVRHRRGKHLAERQPIVRARTLLALWAVLGLIGLAGGLAGLARVPITDSGHAIVVPAEGDGAGMPGIVVLLPADAQDRIALGDPVRVRLSGGEERLTLQVATVDATVVSPAGLRERFPVTISALAIAGPSTVLRTSSPTTDLSPYLGAMLPAEVEIGSRRVGTYVPVLGRLFGD